VGEYRRSKSLICLIYSNVKLDLTFAISILLLFLFLNLIAWLSILFLLNSIFIFDWLLLLQGFFLDGLQYGRR
jgi:hypothetical protein